MSSKNITSIKNTFNDKIGKAQYLKRIIRNLVENGDFDNAEEKIKEYKKLFPKDIEITSIEIVILIMKGEIDVAEKYALEGLKKVPFNFDLNYNLGYIYQIQEKYQDAVDAFIKARTVAITNEEKTIIENAINGVKNTDSKVDTSKMHELNYKLFPLKTNNDTWIGKQLFEGDKEYISLYYNERIESYPTQLWNFYKTETFEARAYEKGIINIDSSGNIVLPLAVFAKNTLVTVNINNREFKFNDFVSNRFYYIPIKDEGKIKIESNKKFIIGEPISLVQNKKHNIRLALNLFIDGLSQNLLDKYSLEKLMPNTYNFFKRGTIFTNCYSNAEWTLPSVPSIFLGKYQANHKIFHPELLHSIDDLHKTIGDYFKNDDYLTFQCCGNWRKTPSYGYIKGFDRTIYQSATIGSQAEDIILSFLEQMRSFPNRDQFIWLSFFELHNVADNIIPKISNQIINGIDSRIIEDDSKKSVHKGYDENKIEKYINEINRLDYYLKIVYDMIEDNYSNDEILITLCSDHGQSYLDRESYILKDARAKVPFMIRGKGIPSSVSDELIENVDILPTILEKCSIVFDPNKLDGKIPNTLNGKEAKDYVYSESIYPGKTYKAIIRDYEHSLIFESENNVEQDGRFILGNFKTKLENNLTRKDETNENYEKVSKYFDIIIGHISDFMKI